MIHSAAEKSLLPRHARAGLPPALVGTPFALPESAGGDVAAIAVPARQEDAAPGSDLPTPDPSPMALFLPQPDAPPVLADLSCLPAAADSERAVDPAPAIALPSAVANTFAMVAPPPTMLGTGAEAVPLPPAPAMPQVVPGSPAFTLRVPVSAMSPIDPAPVAAPTPAEGIVTVAAPMVARSLSVPTLGGESAETTTPPAAAPPASVRLAAASGTAAPSPAAMPFPWARSLPTDNVAVRTAAFPGLSSLPTGGMAAVDVPVTALVRSAAVPTGETSGAMAPALPSFPSVPIAFRSTPAGYPADLPTAARPSVASPQAAASIVSALTPASGAPLLPVPLSATSLPMAASPSAAPFTAAIPVTVAAMPVVTETTAGPPVPAADPTSLSVPPQPRSAATAFPSHWQVAPVLTPSPVPVAVPSIPAAVVAPTPRLPDEPSDPLVATGLTGAAASSAPTAFAAVAETPMLDLRQERWPADMVSQIERLRDAVDATDTRIRLLPDALGSVEVDVRQDGDTLHVRFAAEHAQTRTLLHDAQPRLAEAAEARGLKLGQSSVDTGAHGQSQRQPTPSPAAATPRRSSHPVADRQEPADDARIA